MQCVCMHYVLRLWGAVGVVLKQRLIKAGWLCLADIFCKEICYKICGFPLSCVIVVFGMLLLGRTERCTTQVYKHQAQAGRSSVNNRVVSCDS